MFNLKYKDKIIKCPSYPHEISLEKGMAIHYIRTHTDDVLLIQDKRDIISLLTNLSITVVNLWDDKTIENIFSKIHLFEEQKLITYDVFKLGKTKYGLIDFDSMTLREYEEILFYLNQGESSFDFIDKLCCLSYRPITHMLKTKRNILYNVILRIKYRTLIPVTYKEYKVKAFHEQYDENIEEFRKKLDYRFALTLFSLINEFNKRLANEFKVIFGNEDVDKEDKELSDEEQSEEYKEEIKKKDTIGNRWGFYHILSTICNDDIKMMEHWRKKPIKEFFVHLTYITQKQYDEYLRNKNYL